VPEQVAEPKVTDEIGNNALMGYGLKVANGEPATSERAKNTLFPCSWFICR